MDAGPDGSPDAGIDAPRDAGPACDPACGVATMCCTAEDGAPECADVNDDVRNCGTCGVDCIAEQTGTRCDRGSCACGSSVTGCPARTVCCPPRPGQDFDYCADFDRDVTDCGGCDVQCEVGRADRCDGSRCLCGDGSRRQCDGTATDTCCADLLGTFECVDMTTDRRHCGACGNSCGALACVGGECT